MCCQDRHVLSGSSCAFRIVMCCHGRGAHFCDPCVPVGQGGRSEFPCAQTQKHGASAFRRHVADRNCRFTRPRPVHTPTPASTPARPHSSSYPDQNWACTFESSSTSAFRKERCATPGRVHANGSLKGSRVGVLGVNCIAASGHLQHGCGPVQDRCRRGATMDGSQSRARGP
jgi:hypothetical protein